MILLSLSLLMSLFYAGIGFYILKTFRSFKGITNNILLFVRYYYLLSLVIVAVSYIPLGISKYFLIVWFAIVTLMANVLQSANIRKFDIILVLIFIIVGLIDTISGINMLFFLGAIYIALYTIFYSVSSEYRNEFKRIVVTLSIFSTLGVLLVSVVDIMSVRDITSIYTFIVVLILVFSSIMSYILILSFYSKEVDNINNDITRVLLEKENKISKMVEKFEVLKERFNTCSADLEISRDKIERAKLDDIVRDISMSINEMGPLVEFTQKVILDYKDKINRLFENVPSLSREFTNNLSEINNIKQLIGEINTNIMSLVKLSLDSERSVMGVSKSIKELRASAKNLSENLKVFSDISDQSSILSINISVEASKLGSKGTSFSKLSQQAKKFSDVISTNVNSIKNFIKELDSKAEFSEYMIKTLVMSFIEIETSLKNISKTTTTILERFELILNIAENMSRSLEEVNKMVYIMPEFSSEVNKRLDDIYLNYKKLKKYYEDIVIAISSTRSSIKNIIENVSNTISYITSIYQ
ncbi:MAG: methyl-accepting chemotaxis protein [Brevinematales bacterium]|nr:methyl-accepting chemotaxis protein [Brevinematales bacterium]